MIARWKDPDETEGRALYRAKANGEARMQVALVKRRVEYPKCDCGALCQDRRDGCRYTLSSQQGKTL